MASFVWSPGSFGSQFDNPGPTYIWPPPGVAPSAFSMTSVTPYIEQNTIVWAASSAATTYTLKRGTAPGVYPTTVSTNAVSPYVDASLTSGTQYYYRVYAVNSFGTTTSTNEFSGIPPIFSSLLFDGATSYLSAGTNAALNPNYNTPFWASLWVKTSAGGQPTLFSNLNVAGNTGLYVLLNSGKPRITLYGGGFRADVQTTSVTVNDGNWHLLTFVASGTGLASGFTIYVDGASAALTTIADTLGTHSTQTTADFTLGCDLAGGSPEDFYTGYMNQFAFKVNATLTAGNVTSIYNSGIPTDLAAFTPGVWQYLFGGSDTIAAAGLIDRGSAGVNFTPTGMTSASVINNIRIALGTAFLFNGTDTQMNGGTTSALNYDYTQKIIFTIWVYVTAADLHKGSLFCREQLVAPYKGYDHFITTAGQNALYYANNFGGGDLLLLSTTAAIPTDQWVLLIAYQDGTGTAAGVKFWTIPAGTFVNEKAKTVANDGLVSSVTSTLNYTMGNVELDTGNDFFKGKFYNAGIILNQTCDNAFIQAYISNNGYPRDLTLAPGIAHLWQFASPDTASTVSDQVGSVTLTTQGTGLITTKAPTWFD